MHCKMEKVVIDQWLAHPLGDEFIENSQADIHRFKLLFLMCQ